MAIETATKPVEDTIGKVNDEVAVGEDLVFQRRWWKFERAVWLFFAFLVLLDVLGIFGRGPLSKAHKQSPDGALRVDYEWVERFSTPSILTVRFGPGAVKTGMVRILVSGEVVQQLGNQRIIPEPLNSATAKNGVIYTFSATDNPSLVEFALQPAVVGRSHFTVSLITDGTVKQPQDSITANVFVMP